MAADTPCADPRSPEPTIKIWRSLVSAERLGNIKIGLGADNVPDYISASKVREAIKTGKLDDVIDFLPDSTRDFLYSDDSLDIRKKIKEGKWRH